MSTLRGGPNIITNGLVFYFDAANPKSYISGSQTISNLGTLQISGSLINSPIYNFSNGGNLNFSISNYSYIEVESSSSLNVGNNITVFSVFKPASSASYQPIASKLSASFVTGWEMSNSGGPLRATLRPGISNNLTDSSNLNLNQWYCAAFTHDTTSTPVFKLFKNGIQVGGMNTTSVNLDANGYLNIARRNAVINNENFSGSIALTMVYNRALSNTEILQNYNAIKSRFGI